MILLNDAIQTGYDKDYLMNLSLEAVQDKFKEEKLLKTLFYSDEQGKEFFKEYKKAKMDFAKKFPEVEKLASQMDSNLDNSIQMLFTNFDDIFKLLVLEESAPLIVSGNRQLKGMSADPDEGPVCGSFWNAVKLEICMLACGIVAWPAGPIGLGLCGWTCWCTFCTINSDVADILCSQPVDE